MMNPYRCLTNNPWMLQESISGVEFHPVSIPQLFSLADAELARGYRLLSHPLTGSIRPDITPYKSILLSGVPDGPDQEGREILRHAICYTDALFHMREQPLSALWDAEAREDFGYVDCSLIRVALERNL